MDWRELVFVERHLREGSESPTTNLNWPVATFSHSSSTWYAGFCFGIAPADAIGIAFNNPDLEQRSWLPARRVATRPKPGQLKFEEQISILDKIESILCCLELLNRLNLRILRVDLHIRKHPSNVVELVFQSASCLLQMLDLLFLDRVQLLTGKRKEVEH